MIEVYLHKLNELLEHRTSVVSVILVDAIGSTPQDQGSKMLVTAEGLYYGTVGGGRIESRAIETAQTMLTDPNPKQRIQFFDWNLQKDIGMTCGGSVKLYFEAFHTAAWQIVVFGAGHVANTLIPVLLNLECQVTCLDTRQEWLAKLPESSKLTVIHTEDLPAQVDSISEHAFVVLMTKGHKTDRPILQRFLERGSQPYIGVIGSKAKAAVLRKELRENGIAAEKCKEFICPLGLSIGTNDPQEIAISIVAQLLEVRDRVFGMK